MQQLLFEAEFYEFSSWLWAYVQLRASHGRFSVSSD